MTNGTYAALRTMVGVALETIKGTPVPQTQSIPVTKFDTDHKVAQLTDAGWRGAMGSNYGMQNGTKHAEVDLSGDVFADTIGFILGGVLGDVATTGVSAPYTHKIALLNSGDGQPKSFTLTDNQGGLQTRQFPGAQISEATIKFDVSGLLNYDAKAITWASVTATDATSNYTTLVPIPSWGCVAKIAGTQTAQVESLELAIKRASAEPIFTLGADNPYAIHVGGIEVTTKITFVAKDEQPVLDYLAGTTQALDLKFTQGTNSVEFQMTQHHYDDAKITRGKSYVEAETTGVAILNTTDVGTSGGYSPILATIINPMPSGTFQ